MMLQHGPTQHHLATCAVLLPAAALLLLAAAKVHRMQGDAELATVQRPAAVHYTHLTAAHLLNHTFQVSLCGSVPIALAAPTV